METSKSFDDVSRPASIWPTSAANIRLSAARIGAAGLTVTPLAGDDLRPRWCGHDSFLSPAFVSAGGPGTVSTSPRAFFAFATEQLRENLVLFSGPPRCPFDPVAMRSACTAMDTLLGTLLGSTEEIENPPFRGLFLRPHLSGPIKQGLPFLSIQVLAAATSAGRGFSGPQPRPPSRWSCPRFCSLLRGWLPPANAQLLEEMRRRIASFLSRRDLRWQRPRGP